MSIPEHPCGGFILVDVWLCCEEATEIVYACFFSLSLCFLFSLLKGQIFSWRTAADDWDDWFAGWLNSLISPSAHVSVCDLYHILARHHLLRCISASKSD